MLNFLHLDELNHYSLHETLDVTHATELFSLFIPYIINDELSLEMKEGITNGYNIMNEWIIIHSFIISMFLIILVILLKLMI